MTLALPNLSSALSGLYNSLSAYGKSLAPAAPNTSYVSAGVSSPAALAAAAKPAALSSPYKAPSVPASPLFSGAQANQTAATGTVPYIPSTAKGGGMSVVPTMTSVATGKPASAAPAAVTPKTVAPYTPPAMPKITPTTAAAPVTTTPAKKTPASTPAAPSFSTASVTPAAAPAAAASPTIGAAPQGNYQSATYTPSPSNDPTSGMGGAGTTMPDGAGGIDMEKLMKEYQDTLEASPEEKAARKRLDQLNQSASTAYVNAEGQAIPLPFITGQQAQIQRSSALLTQPLEAQLTDLSGYRSDRGTALKALIDQENEASKPFAVSAGQTYATYNPKTGAFNPLYTAPSATSASGFTLSPGDVRYDANGNPLASGGPTATDTKDAAAKTQQIKAATDQANNAITAIDKALGQVDGAFTTGIGSLSAAIPGTPAANLSSTISTIKSVVAFQALQAMREASPTGGALGQVSDNEGKLLSNSIAALDQSQSKEQLVANLQQVRTHFANLLSIIQQANAGGGGSDGGSVGDSWDSL